MPSTASLSFDGSNDVAYEASNSGVFSTLATYTVEFWHKSITGTAFWGNGGETFFQIGDWNNNHILFGGTFGETLQYRWTTGGTDANNLDYDLTGIVGPDTWMHIAATYDGTTRRLYVNGAPVASTASHSVAKPGTVSARTLMGARASGDATPTDGYFKGKMDEIRIWSAVRSDAEIAAYYDKKATGSETNLVICWHLDEGSGTTSADAAGTAHNLTISGATWDTSDFPSLTDATAGAASGLILPPAYRHQHMLAR